MEIRLLYFLNKINRAKYLPIFYATTSCDDYLLLYITIIYTFLLKLLDNTPMFYQYKYFFFFYIFIEN